MNDFGVYGDLHVSVDGFVATAEIRRPPNNFFDLDLIDGLVGNVTEWGRDSESSQPQKSEPMVI